MSGEIVGLSQGENHKVVVRILRDDATDTERLKFLQEATPHKIKTNNGNHLVLGLVAACIKMDPLLLIFESSPWVGWMNYNNILVFSFVTLYFFRVI